MTEYITASIVAGSGLLAQVIARIRCIFRPGVGCVSGCTDRPLEHDADPEIVLQKVDLHGTEVVVISKN